MAEGRMLKKAISTSRRLSELKSDSARLLYTWILPHLDIKGRISADPSIIKGSVVPRIKSFTLETIEEHLEELNDAGLVTLYDVDGDKYLELRKFEDHQNLNPKREAISKIPDPPQKTKRRCLRKAVWIALWGAWEKSDRICPVCGKKAEFVPSKGFVFNGYIKPHIDHIVPISKGGTNDEGNLRIVCAKCNLSKGNSIDDIDIAETLNENSRGTLENSRGTPAEVKLREVKLSKSNAREEKSDPPVDNSPAPPSEETEEQGEDNIGFEEFNPGHDNGNGKKETFMVELRAMLDKIFNIYADTREQRQIVLFVESHISRGNPNAILHCLNSLLRAREKIKPVRVWLDAAMKIEDGKHNAEDYDKKAQGFKKPVTQGELNQLGSIFAAAMNVKGKA